MPDCTNQDTTGAYLVQTKAQGCQQSQEADTWHPQVTKTVLHQHVASLEGGLESDGLSKRGPHSTPATLQGSTGTDVITNVITDVITNATVTVTQ